MLLNVQQLHRLITKEDGVYFHIHKILGTLVLGHFLFRLGMWASTGVMGFDHSIKILMWIAVHMLLHVSSFEFSIPQRRIKSYNVIWPEFRLHSMIFAYRSLICMVIMWGHMAGYISVQMEAVLRGVLVMITIFSADAVTTHFQSKGLVDAQETTMRTNPYPQWFPKDWIRHHNLFYSASQVLATMTCLSSKDIAFPFVLLVAIQTAPFCMTLVKKGVIDQTGWHVYYTAALGVAYAYGCFGARIGSNIPRWVYWILSFGIMIGRFRFGTSKYILWTSVVLFHTVWVFIMSASV